jgi:CRISPR-associated protein Cmr3
MSNALILQVDSVDTWFFRESRPHDAAGSQQLSSLFPPPTRTVMGAIKTWIGDLCEVRWQERRDDDYRHSVEGVNLRSLLGDAKSDGSLNVAAVDLVKGKDILLPAPSFLMSAPSMAGGDESFVRLRLGNAVRCDAGVIRLPELPAGTPPGVKPLENAWLSAKDFRSVVSSRSTAPTRVYRSEDLFVNEARLGIAVNSKRRSVEEGLLYQTRHVRARGLDGLSLRITVTGIPTELRNHINARASDHPIIRLGGEGRPSGIRVVKEHSSLSPPDKFKGNKFLLTLLSPGDFGDSGWCLPGFLSAEHEGIRVWEGQIEGIPLRMHGAIVGKPVREGGWNLQAAAPRALRSLVPPGSCYFVEATGTTGSDAASRLHGCSAGFETILGRGRLVASQWFDQE